MHKTKLILFPFYMPVKLILNPLACNKSKKVKMPSAVSLQISPLVFSVYNLAQDIIRFHV